MHAHACKPAGRRSFGLSSMWPRLCHRKSCYAPCSMSAKGFSISSSELCHLRFLWQNSDAVFHRVVEGTRPIETVSMGLVYYIYLFNHPWLTAFDLWGQTTRPNRPPPLPPSLYRFLGCWTQQSWKHHRQQQSSSSSSNRFIEHDVSTRKLGPSSGIRPSFLNRSIYTFLLLCLGVATHRLKLFWKNAKLFLEISSWCWKTKNSVVDCKASENVCEKHHRRR